MVALGGMAVVQLESQPRLKPQLQSRLQQAATVEPRPAAAPLEHRSHPLLVKFEALIRSVPLITNEYVFEGQTYTNSVIDPAVLRRILGEPDRIEHEWGYDWIYELGESYTARVVTSESGDRVRTILGHGTDENPGLYLYYANGC